jgi:hypothetical protein
MSYRVPGEDNNLGQLAQTLLMSPYPERNLQTINAIRDGASQYGAVAEQDELWHECILVINQKEENELKVRESIASLALGAIATSDGLIRIIDEDDRPRRHFLYSHTPDDLCERSKIIKQRLDQRTEVYLSARGLWRVVEPWILMYPQPPARPRHSIIT